MSLEIFSLLTTNNLQKSVLVTDKVDDVS